ncbi:MAG: penicillin-binding protein activator LpoB [Alphaproteobacteria bacterium]|nr:penicillin-binding protein activator LpoB [Alphaproteobacteria bacterium]
MLLNPSVLFFRRTLYVLLLGALVACGGNTYNEAGEEDISSEFGVRDFRSIVSDLVTKMVGDDGLREDVGSERPPILVVPLRNLTDEHIDTNLITNGIKSDLSKARLFTFVRRDNLEVLRGELAIEESGLGDPDTVARIGKVVGAQYVLGGEISSITTREGRKTQIYYRVTITLTDIETGIDVWIDDTEVSKSAVRGIL